MEIRSDHLVIQHYDRDLEGNPVEPEQQPATRILGVDGPTSLGATPTGKELTTTVELSDTAGQFAQGFRSQCHLCRHFQPEAAQRVIQAWKAGTLDQRHVLNQIRGALMETQNTRVQEQMINPQDGDTDVEHGLSLLGLCEVFTELTQDVLFVHPTGCCPEDQNYFVAKDIASEKYGSAKFDEIMRKAQGKT